MTTTFCCFWVIIIIIIIIVPVITYGFIRLNTTAALQKNSQRKENEKRLWTLNLSRRGSERPFWKRPNNEYVFLDATWMTIQAVIFSCQGFFTSNKCRLFYVRVFFYSLRHSGRIPCTRKTSNVRLIANVFVISSFQGPAAFRANYRTRLCVPSVSVVKLFLSHRSQSWTSFHLQFFKWSFFSIRFSG